MNSSAPSSPARRAHLLDFAYSELESAFVRIAEKPYRLKQVCDWVFQRRAEGFEQMTNLPHPTRERLARAYFLRGLTVAKKESSHLDPTVKFSFQTGGKNEDFSAVFLPHLRYNSLCISTQVGCAWKCQFCASGLVPFQRNLTSGEILDQVFWAERETGKKIQNVLFMGMGEPLANYEGTVKALRWLTSGDGFRFNPKRITLSTTGVAPQIEKIAREKLNANLALSLHAPEDELRRKIMPVSAKFRISAVLAACKTYQTMNSSDFTIEYILLKDTNDSLRHAEQLAKLLRGARFPQQPKINLIPYNPVPDLPYDPPSEERTQAFFQYLKKLRFIVHSRKPQGQDIGAACGQLGEAC